MQQKRARTSADTAAPRGTVCGKPAYATGAFPTLAPALVRRRPRRTSRRAKRPSPQPCPRRRRANASSRRRRGTKKLQNESRRWRVGGVEVPSRIRAGCRRGGKQPPIDRPGRTCATAASPRRRSSLEQERAQARGQGKVAVERGAQVGAGADPSGAGEKSQGDSHGVKASGRRRRRPVIARGDSG